MSNNKDVPPELLEKILFRASLGLSPSKFLQLRLVSSAWNSTIMQESVLNKFFQRRFTSRPPVCFKKEDNLGKEFEDHPIPPNLATPSSSVLLISYTNEFTHLPHTPHIPGGTKDFSLSFWAYLPDKGTCLNIKFLSITSSAYVQFCIEDSQCEVYSRNNDDYRGFRGKNNVNLLPKQNTWFHVVCLHKANGQCSLYLDAQKMEWKDEHLVPFYRISEVIDLVFNSGKDVLRLADVQHFDFLLTPLEIEAIHEQKCSVHRVNVGTYFREKLSHSFPM
ncbi:unnamed protein product [Rotaria magnacalcarata]